MSEKEEKSSKKISYVLPFTYGELIQQIADATCDTVANISQRAVIEYIDRIVDSDRLKKLSKKD
jgi:hypothetical protein